MKSKSKKAVKTKSKLHLLNIKVTDAEHKQLVNFARKYANGNLSAWLRHAGTSLKRPLAA